MSHVPHTPDSFTEHASGNGLTEVSAGIRWRGARIKLIVLLALLTVHCLITLFAVVPGHLSIDEAIYSLMLKNFSKTYGLEIWTGFQEFPSGELAHEFLRVDSGRPVSQYPYLYPVVALPLYWVAGFRGLFIINSLAFIGVVALCFALARRLFRDSDLALNACLILVLATYLWEYSQSAWPHMTALFFIMSAFYLAACAYFGEAGRKRFLFAAGAGLVAGFAPGIRVDAILILPCLVLPFVFARPWRPWEAIVVCLSSIPGLAVLAGTNYIKFGVFSPFSYGTSIGGHTPSIPVPFAAALLAAMVAIWAVTRPVVRKWLVARKELLVGLVLAVAVVVLALPQTRELIHRTAMGIYMMAVDLRVLDPSVMELSLTRSQTGGLIYIGELKKSLLQSMPYLVVLVMPLLSPNLRRDFVQLAVLALTPVVYLGVFGYMRDHGGLCLNLRFFLPVLPFMSILAAYSIRDLWQRWSVHPGPFTCAIVAIVTAAAYLLLSQVFSTSVEDREFALLVVPLLLAGFLLALLLGGEFVRVEGADLLRSGAWMFLIAALTWSAMVSFFYDYPGHRAQRGRNHFFGEQVLRVIPSDSLFFTFPFIDPFMRLIEKDRVRIALPSHDKFRDFPKLIDFYLKAGKRVFGVFPPVVWEELKAGPLADYRTKPIMKFPGASLAEIVPKSAGQASPGS